MKYLVAIIALLAFTFVSCDQSQAPTQPTNNTSAMSKATVEKDIPLDFGCGQYCDGCGCLCLTGTAHLVINNNGIHVDIQLNGTGIDCATGEPNGVKWTGHEGYNLSANGGEESVVINGQGKECNLHAHITVNANGDVTSYHVSCD